MSYQSQIETINQEIESIDVNISLLRAKKDELILKRGQLYDIAAKNAIQSDHKEASTSYEDADNFPWSHELTTLAKQYFNITSFRSLQLPILNAALDQKRDLFIVLPTGGGKSLCYQLPPLLEEGFTLVISPLISLIKDQIYHLEEANIPCASLTGASTKEQVNSIQKDMVPKEKNGTTPFKLLYVTPEKIAKSKRFMARLNKAYDAGMLTRIVVDEAHCCSQQGHDFRPDYKQLNILRTVFPKTKIMALTATCPWSVMKDVMKILNMKQPHVREGTLVFSAPLYRPNLVYSVVPRPESAEDTIRHIVDWILENHENESGIIYCLSKKDTEVVAQKIYIESKGRIRCGSYHADMDDEDKEMIHKKWRTGELQVITATIAFGMGINHLETRFIIHHCISKSMEGYYQESGRAGRDGKRADCVLYYRGSDAIRLSQFVVGEVNGRTSLYEMVNYAQDYLTCRKVLFEKYFSFDADGEEGLVNKITPNESCGICDNCQRPEEEVITEDIYSVALSIVKLCGILKDYNERVTMTKLVQMLQGRGLGIVKSRVLEDHSLNIPIDRKYSDYDVERIINHLLLNDYLSEDYLYTPYSTITYIIVGKYARDLLSGVESELDFNFLNKPTAPVKRRKLNQQSAKKAPEYIVLDDD